MNSRSKLAVLLTISLLGLGCDIFFSPTIPTPPPNDQKPPEPNPPSTPPTPPPVSVISIADVILETNNQRRLNGLAPLSENSKLNAAADYKMRDMFARQYISSGALFVGINPKGFNHRAPDGTSGIEELLPKFGYQYSLAGENLAMGDFKNAVEIVALWMNSPGHRANILRPEFKEIGVATGYDYFSSRKTIIVVQIFGTPR